MTPRQQRAVAVRDAALVKLQAEGNFEEVLGIGPILTWHARNSRCCVSEMLFRTPFQALPGLKPETVPRAAVTDSPIPAGFNLPYGLDIWTGKKVLNIEWCADGYFEIVSFRRGDWESTILSWATCAVPGQ